MSDRDGFGRRTFLRTVAGIAVAMVAAPRRVFAQADQGIGGTGAVPVPPDPDQGIGGTGVIGTIRRFGSIIVNDMRISYAPSVAVTIDGEPATASALKLGHVVRVVAVQRKGHFSTRSIAVTSEVVGAIESMSAKRMTVLGQPISLEAAADAAGLKVGDHVGVSGLRRIDGTIVASRIEPRSNTINRVSGPVVRGSDGTLKIGRLRLAGLDATWIGRRAILSGQPGSAFAVETARTEQELLGSGVARLSLEDYVERRGSILRLGSGRLVAGGSSALEGNSPSHAVITSTVDRAGHLRLESLRPAVAPEHRRDATEPAGKGDPAQKPAGKSDAPNIHDLEKDGIQDQRPSDAGRGGRSPRSRGGGRGFPHGGGHR